MELHIPVSPPKRTGRCQKKAWINLCDSEGKELSFLLLKTAEAYVCEKGQYVRKSAKGLWRCCYHEECTSWKRIQQYDGLWYVQGFGQHSNTIYVQTYGIPKILRPFIDPYLLHNLSPLIVLSKARLDIVRSNEAKLLICFDKFNENKKVAQRKCQTRKTDMSHQTSTYAIKGRKELHDFCCEYNVSVECVYACESEF